ncbi:MAG: acyltransferase family protein [Gemmatimonadota bacterium]
MKTTVPARLTSLDAFRGLTIAGMILVNNPGSWAHVYAPLRHAEWNGWTPTDLIFPYFLFILGVAVPFSFSRRLSEGARRVDLFRHVLRRAVILIALGLFMRIFPDMHVSGIRWPGVLQRIGLVYLAAAGLYLAAGPRARWAWTGVLLFGYWAAMTLIPVPGYGAGDLTPEGNLAAWVDRLLMSGHLYQGTWDPEGLLSTLPAVATALLGVLTGEWIRSERGGERKVRGMLAAGATLVAVGWAWGLIFPINKNLWTSSYVVFTAGTALLLFGAMYWALDVKGWKGRGSLPLVVYGMNAIAVFVLSGLVTKMLIRVHTGGGDGPSAYAWIYRNLFASWAGDLNGSLAFALAYVTFWWGAMALLYRRGIFIKI